MTTRQAKLPFNFSKIRIDQQSKKLNVLLSISPFALAACGGGGGTEATSNSTTPNENPQSPDPGVIKVLTPLEQLTNQLAQSQGLQTQFTPGANIPNEKYASGLDPANYFENSNKTHFYGFSDTTVQPERTYAGVYTPERVVTYFPEEALFFVEPKTGDQYLFINESVGYATTLEMKVVPRLFKYEDGTFTDVIPVSLPDLPEMRAGGNTYVLANVDGSLGLVSSSTDSGNDLGGDILLLGLENSKIVDLTTNLPTSLSDELYGRQNAVNVHGMGVGDITGNGASDIVLGDIDIGIYAMAQGADGSWSIYQPDVFSWFMYDQDPNTVPENYSYRVTQLEVIDVNNDGYGDIFLSFEAPGVTNKAPERLNLIYMNDGNGNFSIENQIELSDPVPYVDIDSQTIDAEVIDINRDGFDDFILFSTAVDPHYAGFNLQIQINHNGTHFVDETSERLTSFQDRSVSERFNDYAYNFQYLDLNNDGHIDFLNYDRNYFESDPNDDLGKLQVFLNDGSGYFTEIYVEEHWAAVNAENPYSTSQPFQLIAADDFDADGVIDFVSWHVSGAGTKQATVVWYAQSSFTDPVHTGPNQIDVSSIAPGYNELFYLRTNPDVEALVEQGVYDTGLHHYLDVGLAEARSSFAPHSKVVAGDEGWELILSSGDETAIGGSGNDILYGSDGNDTLTGGDGADVFKFVAGDSGTDLITDFSIADGDKVDLSSYGITSSEEAQPYLTLVDGNTHVQIDNELIVTMFSVSVTELSQAEAWIV
jgi:hypothetical protein